MFIRIHRGGQTTTYMLLLLSIILAIAMVMVNIGYVGVTRTHMSNAADAGALAGASWIASTENVLAFHSQMMTVMYIAFFLYLLVLTTAGAPFETLWEGTEAVLKYNIFQLLMFVRGLIILSDGWEQAKKSAITYAFMNAGIESKAFPDWLQDKLEGDDFVGSDSLHTVRYPEEGSEQDWDRNTEDPERGENVVIVERAMTQRVSIGLQWFGAFFLYWPPCVPTPVSPCVPVPSIKSYEGEESGSSTSWVREWVIPVPLPVPGAAVANGIPFPMVLPAITSLSARNDTGNVRVTVKHETQAADLRLAQMVYAREDDVEPAVIDNNTAGGNVRSHAWAEYGGGALSDGRICGPGVFCGFNIGMPRDNYTLQLMRVQ